MILFFLYLPGSILRALVIFYNTESVLGPASYRHRVCDELRRRGFKPRWHKRQLSFTISSLKGRRIQNYHFNFRDDTYSYIEYRDATPGAKINDEFYGIRESGSLQFGLKEHNLENLKFRIDHPIWNPLHTLQRSVS